MKLRSALLLAVLLVVAWLPAHAQSAGSVDPYEEYGKHLRAAQEVTPLTSDLFGDQVSLYNGATEFNVVDINLPGNSGLPVQLRRRFVINDRRVDPGRIAGMGDWDVDVPYIEGVFTQQDGWVVVDDVGNRSTARCSIPSLPYVSYPGWTHSDTFYAQQVWNGNQVHIPGGTDGEMLKNTEPKLPAVADGKAYPWVTKDYYRFGCLPSANGMAGESFYALSPKGEKYTFNWTVQRVAPNLRLVAHDNGAPLFSGYDRYRIFLLATRVEDRFGNWVTYTYSNDHLISITANDGREIDLTWSGDKVTSATAGGRTWSYTYDANGFLNTVTLPDQSQWRYTVASGSLKSVKTLIGQPPGLSHCQSDQDLPPNTGSFVYSVDAPSGAHGTFIFEYERHARDFVPLSCVDGNIDHAFPAAYNFFDNFSVTAKQITGAGLGTLTWTYSYGGDIGSYFTANGPYDGSVETYIPTGSCGSVCAESKVVTVSGPTDIVKYTFGTKYADSEGRLLQTETDSLSGQALRTVTNTYLTEAQVGSQTFPPNAGQSLLPTWINPTVGRIRPTVSTVTVQDGDSYTRETTAFDAFAQPTQVTRSNAIAGQQSIQELTTYFNDLGHWVLGQRKEVDNLSTGEVEELNVYNADATLQSHARFGQTLLSYTYNAAGQLASFTDGNGKTTGLSNYYRGIPRLVNYPDGTSQSATVDDHGDITAVTDQTGHTTSYSYNGVGRVTGITYPGGDEVAWLPRTLAYDFVTSVERGLPANHWRRTTTTGSEVKVTYFDAMLRPVISDSAIGGSVQSSALDNYDAKGQKTFGAYPSANALSFTTSPAVAGIKGVTTTYDALGRITQTQQDSELGVLTTGTTYLSGARQQVTDPKGNVTTSSYQVFDQPSYDAVIKVQAPAGITQSIARDLYGNPLSITQLGLYGTESNSVTKTLTYDGYHRLCRTTEPESGSTVMAYDGANNLAWSADGLAITGTGCGQEQVAAGAKTSRTYDAMNRVKTILPPPGTQSTSYGYDAAGRMTSASSGVSAWSATYNFRGLLTGESLQLTGQNAWGIGYAHDAYGSVSLIHYPDGENVSYVPDALGRATQVSSYASGLTYFPDGEVKDFVYGNGAVYAAEKNARQLVSNFSYGQGATPVVSEDYAYDANGNITSVADLANGPRNKSFGYDALNRLTSATAGGLWGTQSYTYDALNNLRTLQTGSQVSTYHYDTTNKLVSISNGATTLTSYLYDTRGNVTGKNATTLVFDQKNQLTRVMGIGDYAYDAAGRRVMKTPTSGGAPVYYFYNQAGQLLYQANPGKGTTTNLIYLGRKLVARNESLHLVAPGAVSFDANPNNGSYTVSWGAVPGATSYLLQESANGGAWTTVYSGSAASKALSGKAGGSYVYRVEGCVGTTCGGWTSSATLGVRPALPTVTVPTGTINGSYTVSWTAPASATGYDVQERVNGGAWTTIASSTTATAISRPGTSSGSYTYQVSAKNTYGSRGWAASAAVTVDTTYEVVPTAPASLAVPASSSTGGATLSWSASSFTTSYTLQQSSNGGTSWTAAYTGSGTSAVVSGLVNGSYVYQVQACNTYGCSAWKAGSATLVVTHPPATAPTLSTPASSASGSYTVSWGAVGTATSYALQEQVNGGAWTTIQSSSATSKAISGKGNGTYGYRVQACNVGGCGPWSSTGTTTVLLPPAAPASITVPATSSGSIAVSWAASATATSYTLQQRLGTGSWGTVYAGTATSSTRTVTASGSYTYQVQACNTGGCSTYKASSAVAVTIPPATAPALSVPATNSTGSYTVSWGGVSGATSYTLQEQVNGGGWATVQANSATSWNASGKTTGTYGYHVQACNAGGCGPWSGVSSISAVVPAPIAINGQSYQEDYFIPAKQTGSVAMVFAINSGSTWELYSAVPGATHTIKASGAIPLTAATVQFTWTYVGIPSGYSDAGGTVTNPASSAVAISTNPVTQYLTMTASGGTPRGRTYQLKVDFFNAAGTNISSSTCTLTAMTESGA